MMSIYIAAVVLLVPSILGFEAQVISSQGAPKEAFLSFSSDFAIDGVPEATLQGCQSTPGLPNHYSCYLPALPPNVFMHCYAPYFERTARCMACKNESGTFFCETCTQNVATGKTVSGQDPSCYHECTATAGLPNPRSMPDTLPDLRALLRGYGILRCQSLIGRKQKLIMRQSQEGPLEQYLAEFYWWRRFKSKADYALFLRTFLAESLVRIFTGKAPTNVYRQVMQISDRQIAALSLDLLAFDSPCSRPTIKLNYLCRVGTCIAMFNPSLGSWDALLSKPTAEFPNGFTERALFFGDDIGDRDPCFGALKPPRNPSARFQGSCNRLCLQTCRDVHPKASHKFQKMQQDRFCCALSSRCCGPSYLCSKGNGR